MLFSIKGHICPLYLLSDWIKIIMNRMPADKNTQNAKYTKNVTDIKKYKEAHHILLLPLALISIN